jgi:hypothetical protein
MTNLLSETRDSIEQSGHSPEDITFGGSADAVYRMTWAEFEKLADVEYDSGYGSAEVATDLVIRFSDGKSMWRHEYDGSEGWDYDAPANVDYTAPGRSVDRLVGRYWPSFESLHSEDPLDVEHHRAADRSE